MKRLPAVVFGVVAILHGASVCADMPVHTDADVVAQVDFNPVPGTIIPPDLEFMSTGGPVKIGALLQDRISLLTFAWFDCPNLCGLALNGLADSSGRLRERAEGNFQIVVVSMDSAASRADAADKQRDLAQRYPQAEILDTWHFLTGSADNIEALAHAAGFQFIYDPRKAQFAHPSGVVALDTQGRVRNFMAGINYRASDLAQLAEFAQSSDPAVASANPILLLCYDYDPSSGRYSLAIMKLLRLVSVLCLLIFAGVLWHWRRKGRFHE